MHNVPTNRFNGARKVDKQGFRSQVIRISTVPKHKARE